MTSVVGASIRETPLFWPVKTRRDGGLFVLDETCLPEALRYIAVDTPARAATVIRRMKTRAFGQFLLVARIMEHVAVAARGKPPGEVIRRLEAAAARLNASRPTFPFAEVTGMVVAWARGAVEVGRDPTAAVRETVRGYLEGIRRARLDRVRRLAELLKDGDGVLTLCHVSGELAMAVDWCRRRGRRIVTYVCETRPYLQGARLTAWELRRMGCRVVLIPDNAAGSLMADGLVSKVVVGSDRNSADGDFANKIGTYTLAVLAAEFEVPFYVLTQPSTATARGRDIPVEIRDERELLRAGGRRLFPTGVKGFYPAFDVVPARLVTERVPLRMAAEGGR